VVQSISEEKTSNKPGLRSRQNTNWYLCRCHLIGGFLKALSVCSMKSVEAADDMPIMSAVTT
jgi:hypothetical protein